MTTKTTTMETTTTMTFDTADQIPIHCDLGDNAASERYGYSAVKRGRLSSTDLTYHQPIGCHSMKIIIGSRCEAGSNEPNFPLVCVSCAVCVLTKVTILAMFRCVSVCTLKMFVFHVT